MSNTELIQTFYRAFAANDIEGMVACYAPDVVFADPAFGELRGKDAHDMWRMLVQRGAAANEVSFGNVTGEGKHVTADWMARYQYGPRKRMVINEVQAEFVVENGKIVRHTDRFNLWRWARQALGLNGLLIGWSAFFQARMQETTRGMLKDWQKANG